MNARGFQGTKAQVPGVVVAYQAARGVATIQLEDHTINVHIACIYGGRRLPKIGDRLVVDPHQYIARHEE